MKVICVELKILMMVIFFAVVLGIITVTPCPSGQKNSVLGRCYGFDSCRCKELGCKVKNAVSSMCK